MQAGCANKKMDKLDSKSHMQISNLFNSGNANKKPQMDLLIPSGALKIQTKL